MEVRKGAHGLYKLQYHVVWVTKYRRRILKPFVIEYLQKVLPKLLRSTPGVNIETIGFDQDHVHMVMVIPPKYSIAEVMGRLKGQSSHHEENLQMVGQGVLEGESGLVAGLLRQQCRRE